MEPKITKIELKDIGVKDTYTQNNIANFWRQFDSCNINILLGAGFSCPALCLLNGIEEKMSTAMENELYDLQKQFFEQSIEPQADSAIAAKGEKDRYNFISTVGNIIQNRHSLILHKIVNIFTTNYDLFIEQALEKSKYEYIDGFSGKLNPVFSTSNFGKIISRQTSISSMTSEMVTFNLYKVHGSLNWYCVGDEIIYGDYLKIIKALSAVKGDKSKFLNEYNKRLAIINPTKEKLNTTVLNIHYYDQLRMYCNELEKTNTVLISYGFSFCDEHIKQMTFRALKGNPTLTLVIFCYKDEDRKEYLKRFKNCGNVNIVQLIEKASVSVSSEETVVDMSLDKVNKILTEIFNETK